jgi:hypothetical protein
MALEGGLANPKRPKNKNKNKNKNNLGLIPMGVFSHPHFAFWGWLDHAHP